MGRSSLFFCSQHVCPRNSVPGTLSGHSEPGPGEGGHRRAALTGKWLARNFQSCCPNCLTRVLNCSSCQHQRESSAHTEAGTTSFSHSARPALSQVLQLTLRDLRSRGRQMPIRLPQTKVKPRCWGMERCVATAYSGRKRDRPILRSLVQLECREHRRERCKLVLEGTAGPRPQGIDSGLRVMLRKAPDAFEHWVDPVQHA